MQRLIIGDVTVTRLYCRWEGEPGKDVLLIVVMRLTSSTAQGGSDSVTF